MKGSVIILGDSPFLGEIQDKLRYALDRYHSIGINNVITKYYTNEHIFVDKPFIALTNNFMGKTVTLKHYKSLIPKENKELYEIFPLNLKEHTEKDIFTEDRVAWCGFTHDFAISYAIKKGFDKIILIGAADFVAGPHFSTPYTFKYSSTCRGKSKQFIENYASKLVDIVTCNPKSILNVSKVSIDDLLR